MKVYFPQWQGSGNGTVIEYGARTILEYVNDHTIVEFPLSHIPSGASGKRRHHINNFEALTEQLTRFKDWVNETNPKELRTIGGDCGLEIIPVSYLNDKYKNLGVVWFDAHADINKPCDSPSCNFHGMPLRTLLGEGECRMDSLLFSTIKPHQIHYVGLRDVDEKEQEFIQKEQIHAPKDLNLGNLVQTMKGKGITHLYLHFDFDCLEPTEYPKTYYQVPNGLGVQEAENCVKSLKNEFTIVGASVLESIALSPDELQPITGIVDELMG